MEHDKAIGSYSRPVPLSTPETTKGLCMHQDQHLPASPAPQATRSLVTLARGKVHAVGKGGYTVEFLDRVATMQLAPSCLVRPRPGDHVCLAFTDSEASIIAILARTDPHVELVVSGDLEIQAPNGSIRFRVRDAFDIKARAAHVLVTERLSFVGAVLESSVGHLKTVSTRVEQTAGQLVQRIGEVIRFVRGSETLHAETIRLTAAHVASVHAKTTVVTADDLVKVDGDQIHVG